MVGVGVVTVCDTHRHCNLICDSGGGSAGLSSDAHYVSVQTAPGMWACCQPPHASGFLCCQQEEEDHLQSDAGNDVHNIL